MKSITITLKDASIKGQDVDKVASEICEQGLKISSVHPYGVITGEAEDDLIEKLKQDGSFYINEMPDTYQLPPEDSEIQ